MPEEKKRLLSSSNSHLPVCSEIDDPETFRAAVKLMKEGNKLRAQISELDDRRVAIITELSAICEAYNMKGFRHGLNGFEYHGYTLRKSLNKEKLVTLVPADVIDQCYEDGKPFVSYKLIAFDID